MVIYAGGPIVEGGWLAKLLGLCLWILLLALTIVVRNTTPRMRTDQAMRFFWGPVTLVAVVRASRRSQRQSPSSFASQPPSTIGPPA